MTAPYREVDRGPVAPEAPSSAYDRYADTVKRATEVRFVRAAEGLREEALVDGEWVLLAQWHRVNPLTGGSCTT